MVSPYQFLSAAPYSSHFSSTPAWDASHGLHFLQGISTWSTRPLSKLRCGHLLHCGPLHRPQENMCSVMSLPWKHLLQPGEAVEVIEHRISENMPGCAPVLGATIGGVNNSDLAGFN